MAIGPRVLIGFAESLAAIESAWCLRDAGFEVVAFTRAGRRPALASAKGIRLVSLPEPEADAAASVAALRQLIEAEKPVAVLPLDDASLWLTAALAEVAPEGTAVIAGPVGAAARLALDKSQQVKLAEAAGFPVPRSDGETPSDSGPWMVKSALATVEREGRLTRPAGAIARQATDVARIAAEIGGPVLVQPLIDGVGEGVFGIACGGEVLALSAHRRVRMMNPRGSGSSACESIPVDPALVEPVRRFLAEAGWHGIFMIELLRDNDGRPWFMELNGRAWGSMALAVRRGLDYPQWAVRAAIDPQWRPVSPPEAPHIVCRHLGRETVHLLAVLRGARGGDVGRWPSRGATIAAMLRPGRKTRWYHWRRGEFRVFARDAWATVAEQLGRRR
ncbi:hypothetical protein Rhe02_82230 [Rhizocola hellebori]|uniref:ATP-grasp domain-containing protein n=1 Tax=Rhizocola hellebori TaxID=1392758 RepID=A0A8J3QGI4_9ACTN|nr:ATP-grasp domain-containing protein [Rhizocola hellebori]GIH10156.1 hypothetical protein Rhe02_82230 [Rhizocola hellebori]